MDGQEYGTHELPLVGWLSGLVIVSLSSFLEGS